MNKNVLIAALVIIIGILAYMQFKPKEVVAPIETTSPVVTTPTIEKPAVVKNNPTSAEWKTYTNSSYGFSFQYPSTWKLTENKNTKQVTVDTNDKAGSADYQSYPSQSISFKVTDKTFFTPAIGTKYGNITYDVNRSTLTDGDRCLAVGDLLGQSGSVQNIRYGGSLMSDPSYSDSAILTTNGQIIIVHTESGNTTSELQTEISKIATSFKLLNNTVFVPICAKQAN